MLPQHKRFIEKSVHNALAKNGLNHSYYYDDALGEGLLAFVEALNSYKPEMGTCFSTWLWYRLRYRIGTFIKKEVRQREMLYTLGTGTYLPRHKRKAIKLSHKE